MAGNKTIKTAEKGVGKAKAYVPVTDIGKFMASVHGTPNFERDTAESLGSTRKEMKESKYEAKKAEFDLRGARAKKELQALNEPKEGAVAQLVNLLKNLQDIGIVKVGGSAEKAKIFYPVRKGNKLLIKKITLNPGEAETVGEVPIEEEKGKEKKEGKEAVSLVKETTEAVKAGIAVGKEAAGGGKGINSDEVRKIMEDKIEAYTAKLDAKFDKLEAAIDKGSKSDIVSTIKELQDLGVIPKKKEGKTEGEEGFIGRLAKEIELLEKAGLVVPATKVNEKTMQIEKEKDELDKSYLLALKKLSTDEKRMLMEEATSRKKIELFRGFAKDIGKAVAEGLEESEEEAEEGEEGGEEAKGKKEEVIEESEKTPAGIETFICGAEIEPGVKCGAKVSIPPEVQKEGCQLICPKCGSTYQYVATEEKSK